MESGQSWSKKGNLWLRQVEGQHLGILSVSLDKPLCFVLAGEHWRPSEKSGCFGFRMSGAPVVALQEGEDSSM